MTGEEKIRGRGLSNELRKIILPRCYRVLQAIGNIWAVLA